jgi:CO/xanthine dehydrogenase FAD-binding subunit
LKPAPFKYVAPATLDEALGLLGNDARPLAGGQSLVPLLALRMARPEVLVDLNRLSVLSGIRRQDGTIRIGAMTRHHAFENMDFVPELPLLREAIEHVAHPAVRSRGTLGGSLAHADPAAELPLVALALDARIVLRKRGGERELAADDFFEDVFTTACAADELVTEVAFPIPAARTGTAFVEIARRHGDFAIVAAAAKVMLDEVGKVASARVALGGVAPRPVLAADVAAALAGRAPSGDAFASALADAASAMAAALAPEDDLHASADYRRKIAAVLCRRAVAEAIRRTGA